MDRVSVGEALGSAGFSSRWVLTGGGSAVLRVDHDGWTASIGPFGEDGRPEDPEYMSVLGYDYVPDDDMVGSESYVYDVNVDSVAAVVTAVIGLFGPGRVREVAMEWTAVDALVAAVDGTEWETSWHIARVLDAYRDAMFGDGSWGDVAVLAEESARRIMGPDDEIAGDVRRILAEIAETADETADAPTL